VQPYEQKAHSVGTHTCAPVSLRTWHEEPGQQSSLRVHGEQHAAHEEGGGVPTPASSLPIGGAPASRPGSGGPASRPGSGGPASGCAGSWQVTSQVEGQNEQPTEPQNEQTASKSRGTQRLTPEGKLWQTALGPQSDPGAHSSPQRSGAAQVTPQAPSIRQSGVRPPHEAHASG
jgi:hypothetical protein